MKEYPKSNSAFKRDDKTHKFHLGDWAQPEFGYLAKNEWLWTEKVNGTNIRVMWPSHPHPQDHLTFGGKTDNAQLPVKLLAWLTEKFNEVKPIMQNIFSPGVCLYGEGYGAGIQKGGGNYSGEQRFVLFDVKIGEWWLERKNVEDIAQKLGLDIVPVVGTMTVYGAIDLVRNGVKSSWGDFEAEGLVGHPAIELRTRRGDRIMTKIKTKDF